MLDELFKLIWDLITFPFRLVGSIIKTIVFGPLLVLGTFIVIIVVCVALMAPKEMPRVDVPAPLIDLQSLAQHVIALFNTPQTSVTKPSNVTCSVHGLAVLVEWDGATSSDVAWYLVYRKPLREATWVRATAIPAANKGSAHFQYTDSGLLSNVTYQYGIMTARADGTQGELVVSPVQVVGP
jgi:hypothetical protein